MQKQNVHQPIESYPKVENNKSRIQGKTTVDLIRAFYVILTKTSEYHNHKFIQYIHSKLRRVIITFVDLF